MVGLVQAKKEERDNGGHCALIYAKIKEILMEVNHEVSILILFLTLFY